ncbi:MAG: 3'-5' exonuclease, partial [Ktedonobacterales bacterium]
LGERHVSAQAVSRQSPIRITEPSVKVLTMHGAKGLDFPHVYLVGLTNEGVPGERFATGDGISDETRREVLETQRRLLYTAMIRAGKTLTMTTTTGMEHPLLADLDEQLCQREHVAGG